MVGSKHIDPVKNMSLYHCMTFFNWSPFVRPFIYNNPKFKSLHSSDHRDTTSNTSVTSSTHKARLEFSSVSFLTGIHPLLQTRGLQLSPEQKTAEVSCRYLNFSSYKWHTGLCLKWFQAGQRLCTWRYWGEGIERVICRLLISINLIRTEHILFLNLFLLFY
jgi:hypothetical protein